MGAAALHIIYLWLARGTAEACQMIATVSVLSSSGLSLKRMQSHVIYYY